MALVPICHRWSRVRNEVTTIQPWSVLLLHYIYTKFLKIDHLVRKLRGASTHNDLGVPLFADHIRALTTSFDSGLADVGNRLVRQLGRYLGLIHTAGRAEPSRTEPNRFGLENKPTL